MVNEDTITVADAGEHSLIARIRARAGAAPPWVTIDIGDDAAVIERERNALEVVTTDALVEHVHFEHALCGPADVGHKALAVNLSDLAAMGARPRWALLSLALPANMRVADVEMLADGFLALAASHGVSLIGGNISRSPDPVVVSVTAGGTVRRRGVLARGGAQAGDNLYVSGTIGKAAAGLACLLASAKAVEWQSLAGGMEECVAAYRRPEPRVRLGLLLGRNRAATACIDLSDGLADAVQQLAAANGLGARVAGDKVPLSPPTRRWFERTGRDPLAASLSGGEDYELLVAVPKKLSSRFRAVQRLVSGLPLTWIGTLTADPSLVLVRAEHEEAWPTGFVHF